MELKKKNINDWNSAPEDQISNYNKNNAIHVNLECVWIEYFNKVIHFFEEFRLLCNKMLCLDTKIKKHFKCKHFFEGFQ